jgi:outer membrane lipoprotein-sorting protein
MRWLTVLAVLYLPAPASAQDGDAEKLYRAMEKKVRAAKTLQVAFDGEFDVQIIKGTFKGKVSAAQGNKSRVEMDMNLGGNSIKVLLITDGKVGYTKEGDKEGKFDPNPKEIDLVDKQLPGVLARIGALGLDQIAKSPDMKEDFDLDKHAPVKDFKLGAKEKVGNRDAQVVDSHLKVKGKPAKVSVWIDTQTQLPLKRVLTIEDGGQTVRINENYSNFTIDATLDPNLFDIPK